MKSTRALVVVLGTGGTIAGTAIGEDEREGYRAAQLGVDQLVVAVPPLRDVALECEQVAQVDSKDMSHAIWQALAERAAHHLAREEVAGIVITHGTDTLEETAYFLHRTLRARKPVVLTAAMRPATSLQADGPQNLLDAVQLARNADARGVLVAMASAVHGAVDVRKAHTTRVDAFDSGDAGPIAWIEGAGLRQLRPWPLDEPLPIDWAAPGKAWPRVDVLVSHAGVQGDLVEAAVERGARGLVVAGTGHGTVHQALEAALLRAQSQGVQVWRSTRVAQGAVNERTGDALPAAGVLSPVKARIELMLQLMRKA
jgi:L-asparaginase